MFHSNLFFIMISTIVKIILNIISFNWFHNFLLSAVFGLLILGHCVARGQRFLLWAYLHSEVLHCVQPICPMSWENPYKGLCVCTCQERQGPLWFSTRLTLLSLHHPANIGFCMHKQGNLGFRIVHDLPLLIFHVQSKKKSHSEQLYFGWKEVFFLSSFPGPQFYPVQGSPRTSTPALVFV